MRKYIYWGIILFIVSLIVGYFYGQRIFSGTALVTEKELEEDKETIVSEATQEFVSTASKEIKILPTTKFALEKKYKDCNHISFEFVELPPELINKTKEEVENLYKDWRIEEFYENKVVLYKEVEGIGDEHFIMKAGNEFIEIYKLIDNNENTALYLTTDISIEYLPEEDIKKLEDGIEVYGKDRLNSAIEDFE